MYRNIYFKNNFHKGRSYLYNYKSVFLHSYYKKNLSEKKITRWVNCVRVHACWMQCNPKQDDICAIK